MARHVFFSFHYADIMNANIIRMSGQFKPTAGNGFYDKSLWEEAKSKGDAAIKRLIDRGLMHTSVTCFLIGADTHKRKYCKYELDQSVRLGKGVLGILLPNQEEHGPPWISRYGKVYRWNHDRFPVWVENAATAAGR